MSKQKILGLDLGSNSIGWALLEGDNGKPCGILDIGSRIFTKAVEEKTPTPKNAARRKKRLARRVLERRARRKQRMLNYLIKLSLLPYELKGHTQPEGILNSLGDPYQLRAKALDQAITRYELGRVLLHLVQRRGFLSSRKTLLGDMIDDPDVLESLEELEAEEDLSSERAKEETAFKNDISQLRNAIKEKGCRTLGEYLAGLDKDECKRNRIHEGGHLRTDRQMYRDEISHIWNEQEKHHNILNDTVKEQLEHIIFHQRPIKLRSDRVGKCSLEPRHNRARIARLDSQRFRYLQDINNLRYFEPYIEEERTLNDFQREKLVALFEENSIVTFHKIRKTLGFDKGCEFNLEYGNKKLKGNVTACDIRNVYPAWDDLESLQQQQLVEDLLTIQKKSVLKKRLITYWDIDKQTAVNLCMLEFEPGHSNHSAKAISKLLPYLSEGQIYSDARINAGYGYEKKVIDVLDRLGAPPETSNPIVNKALHELRRVVNAVIAEHGKPDIIRIEMARDLEMNTKKYKSFIAQQKANTKANDEAIEKYQEIGEKNPHLKLRKYPGKADKLRYRLWKDQNERCAYSNKPISLSALFSAEIDIDHILPYSESLDDSYMNKVVCYSSENQYKGQRTPIDAFGGDIGKWEQISQAVSRWPKSLKSKRERFFKTADDVQQRDFISSQLNDTRYISRVAQDYLKQIGSDITTCKGATTAWVRHQWGLNSLIGDSDTKDRQDHRHHAIDAVAIACVDREFYRTLVGIAKEVESKQSSLSMNDLCFEPPWDSLRNELGEGLGQVIISHASQRKLTGALHEDTGVGYIEGVGAVYRVNLDGTFTEKHVNKIIDPNVREIISEHLERYDKNPKFAFAEGVRVLHKDGKTPIKRVRVVQSKTDLKKLEKSKFGVVNKQGKVFKWLAYGNLHHVEIIRELGSGKYKGCFVTTMEAHHRVKGIGMTKRPVIQIDHGSEHEFIMALHINDLVSVERDDGRKYYRVQKLDPSNKRIHLRLHTAATRENPKETLLDRESTIPALIMAGIRKHAVNAIGKLQGD